MQHFQCWYYSYPTSTCLTANTLTSARATSVLTHLINCTKYQKNPTYAKAFVKIRKIREISKYRIYGDKIYDLDKDDVRLLQEAFKNFFSFFNELDDIKIKAEGTI